MYYVWRRSDGYVSASKHRPDNYVTGGSNPEPGSTHRPGSGIPVTFEILGEFKTWDEAYKFILEVRNGRRENT